MQLLHFSLPFVTISVISGEIKMDIKQTVDKIMTREVDRKGFLVESGAALLSIIGFSAMMGALLHKGGVTRPGAYGAAAYAGGRNKSKLS
jgi:hypothetical protein